MPLPQGAKIAGSDPIIIGGGNQWVGRAVVNALQGATDVYAFFQSEYPKSGWTIQWERSKSKVQYFSFYQGR